MQSSSQISKKLFSSAPSRLGKGRESADDPYQQQRFPNPKVLPQTLKQSIIIEYDKLSVSTKLSKYSQLLSAQKTAYIQNICSILGDLENEESYTLLKRLFDDIMGDREEFKLCLLGQIPQLIHLISTSQHPSEKLKKYLFPLIKKFLQEPDPEIKREAGTYLVQLATRLDQQSVGESVLACVLELAHDDKSEDNRVIAVILLAKMAALFGRDLCEHFVGFQFQSLGEDKSQKVRKHAILHVPKLARVVSPEFFKAKTLQFYLDKIKQSNWILRKAAIEIIDEISELCDYEVKSEGVLDQIMLEFLKDTNKLIKAAAYKRLGPYIHTLKGREIKPQLIEAYNKMSTSQLDGISTSNDIVYSCAYNFPAVLDALGNSKWSQLTATYSRLLKHQDKQVRKTLASSLHQLSKILGEKRTKQHLFPVLDKFIKDPRDEIKIESIHNLSSILEILNPEKREELVDIFMTLQNNHKKWRIRLSIATQLSTLSSIYSLQTVFSYIVPIAFKLCCDDVCCVREEAASRIKDVLKRFEREEGRVYVKGVLENIKGFGRSTKYTQRQTFIRMCEGLGSDDGELREMLRGLTKDPIVDVRMTLASVVSHSLIGGNKDSLWQQMGQLLSKDKVSDVSQHFQ